jgi:PAS domain S-box-containing protein
MLPHPGRDLVLEATRRAVHVEGRWLIVSVMRDVTARHALLRKLELLSAAVNRAPDAIVVIDPQAMEYVEVNESCARMFGMTREEMLATGLRRIQETAGWPFEKNRELYRRLVEQAGRVDVVLSTTRLPGGGDGPTLETSRTAVQVDGQWLIVSVMRDVTERTRAAAELEQRAADLARSNRDLEQFAYVSSHDLSEPLRMVGSFTQLIERRYGHLFDEEGREYLGYVIDGAQRMKRLIDDLLLYSRVGRAGERPTPGTLAQALDDGLLNLAHARSESNAVIEREGALGDIFCDRVAMAQVFQNLVGNALKFRGDQAPVIRVGVQRENDEWIVSIADNGIGIAPEYFEKIFVIFQRLHTRERYEGTGIGLAICKKIVERHGGRIWVESAPGEGACFKFTLPVTDAAA